MNKKISLGATLALIIIAMALTVSVTMVVAMRYFNTNLNALAQKQEMFDNIADVDTAVRQQVDTIDESRLRANLAEGYIESIDDPYAAYLTPSEYSDAQAVQKGTVTGFGIDVTMSSDGRAVATLIHQGSAAERAGMQEGDVLTAFDGTTVTRDSFSALESAVDVNTKILLTFTRSETSQSVELTASPYSIESVQERVIGTVGYIRIRSFHENTTDQFKAAYDALEQEGVTAFLFDLRNNEGGTLQSAQDILSYLMPRGNYAVYTDNDGTTTTLLSDDTHQMSLPSVTLVNGATAGEAELFAGALQEFQLTTVVGETTAGKGRIQEYFVMQADQSALRLSVGELSLIEGGAIQDKGIVPTREVSLSGDEAIDFELLDENTDPQLQAALTYLSGGNGTSSTTTPTTLPSETGSSTTESTASSTGTTGTTAS